MTEQNKKESTSATRESKKVVAEMATKIKVNRQQVSN